MNTTELNGTEYKLTEGEGGKITLTPIIKQPEKRTPEAGDVWEDNRFGEAYLIGDEESICLDGRDNPGGVDPFVFIHGAPQIVSTFSTRRSTTVEVAA